MNNLFKGIYKDKRVFITGHTGFKGSWLLLWLKELGAEITGYSLPPDTNPNHISLLNNGYENIYGDICDFDKLYLSILKYKPEIIFHLAAQSLVLKSYQDSINTFHTNILGTVNLLEICRKCSFVKAIVIVTSDKCYNNTEKNIGYKEDDPLGGKDPYSASKACVEIITKCYQESFFQINKFQKTHNLLISTARAGNVIGGGDWANNRIIPDIMKAAFNNLPVCLRNPLSIRPWQFVLESLSGYLLIGQKLLEGKPIFAQSWNFGPIQNEILSVQEIVLLLKRHWKKIQYKIDQNQTMQLETNILKLDSSKAHQFLQWSPVYDIKQAILATFSWYQQYYTQKEVISLKQLHEYIYAAKSKKLEWVNA